MVSEGKLWWVTRPTRVLSDLKLALTDFARLAKGKKWVGNRALQKKFEAENRAKTSNMGSYGSGGRTWAALLRMWGLWYDDKCVTITSAGEVLLSCKNVYQQITRLIMNFQITSAYSEHQKLEDGFKIFPFRFIIQLLLDRRIKFLEEDEIALFLLQVKTPLEYEKTVEQILKYRTMHTSDGEPLKNRKDLIADHMVKYRENKRKDSPKDVQGHWKYIKDIANTIVNNIRFLHDIKYDKSEGTIQIRKESQNKMKISLEEYEREFPFSTLYTVSEKAFAEHYGLRHDRKKASRKATKPQTGSRKKYDRIKLSIEQIKKTKSTIPGTELLDLIQQDTNYQIEDIEKIISDNPDLVPISGKKLDPNYVDYFIECGKSGKDDAEFETMTRSIMTEMGFETKKHKITKKFGTGKPEIDGLSLNKQKSKSGLIECKSGAKYTFPLGDCEKMKNIYIPNFREKTIDEKEFTLDFILYVVGNQASGLENFADILRETKVNGTVIYARDLIKLLGIFRDGKITSDSVWNLFKSNKHLTWKDIDDTSKNE